MRATRGLLTLILMAGIAVAQRRPRPEAVPGDFSYYILVLSYAPDDCAQPQGQKDPRECGSGRKVGFVVHGLWPQGEDTRGPARCGHGRPVAEAIVQMTLSYIPTPGLIQHEWTDHGTCSGLSAADYFAALRKARDAVQIPPDLQPSQQVQTSPEAIGEAGGSQPELSARGIPDVLLSGRRIARPPGLSHQGPVPARLRAERRGVPLQLHQHVASVVVLVFVRKIALETF